MVFSPALLIHVPQYFSDSYRRFHGRGRHFVGRAKNSDRLGRVTVYSKWWTNRVNPSYFTLDKLAFREVSCHKRTFLSPLCLSLKSETKIQVRI